MKFFIINSFRFLVYNAYFGIIALYTFGVFLERQQIQGVISQFTTSGKVLVERGMVDPQTVSWRRNPSSIRAWCCSRRRCRPCRS